MKKLCDLTDDQKQAIRDFLNQLPERDRDAVNKFEAAVAKCSPKACYPSSPSNVMIGVDTVTQ